MYFLDYASLIKMNKFLYQPGVLYPVLRPEQNGCHFADISRWIILNEKYWMLILEMCFLCSKLQFVNIGVGNYNGLVPSGNKPFPEPLI